MRTSIAFVAVGLFAVLGHAGEGHAGEPLAWPQFRGPGGSGVADGQKPPVELGPGKNVKWKVPVPNGLSSPIVAGDKLVITAFDNGKLYTIAYHRASGKEAWRQEAPAKKIEPYFKKGGSPAQPTPATDGERIVSYFGSCGVFCYDLSGKELWKHEMPAATGGFGTGTSPILADGVVVVVQDEMKGSKIFALNAATGKVKWEKKRQSPLSYGTPVVWDTPAGKQAVASGHGKLIGYDLKTGDERWSVTGMPAGVCSSPVAAGGILLFAGWSPGGPDEKEFQMPKFEFLLKDADANKDGVLTKEEAAKTFLADFFDGNDLNSDGKLTRDEWDTTLKFMAEGKNSAFALKPGGRGDVTTSHVLWKKTKGLPYIASAIAYRGQYVMVRDGGLVTAYDPKTGKAIYLQQRVLAEGSYYASPVAANGHIYFASLDDGAITVLKAGSEKAEVAAVNSALGERVAATPAIADNTLYVRTDKHLYAFAER
ncbi:MAG: PQQ-binding-like beta-propeller repeat protein [Gemmataceae bacterium]|nr:PQQ-binding-like beta-propeller repeat protein [Gemmataceae bacterium]